jgi:hypothetical protein
MTSKFSIKGKLIPLRSNDLLGFVRLSHSTIPNHSMLILPFNATSAAWRFSLAEHQLSMLTQGSHLSSRMSIQGIFHAV